MGKPLKALIAGGILGTLAWALRAYLEERDRQARVVPVVMPDPEREARRNPFTEALVDGLFGALDGLRDSPAAPRPANAPTAPLVARGALRQAKGQGDLSALLSLIRKHESGGNYSAVWGKIKAADRPAKPLTSMSIAEVLAWQDSIDSRYNSEAAGAYQILEDTLRGLYGAAGLSPSARFSPANQDRLAVALLRRRGLDSYRAGQMTDVAFAQNLAKEWASLPAQTKDKRGKLATGQSYYAGDGLNAASSSKEAVLAAIRRI